MYVLCRVHVKIAERVSIAADKDSGLQNMEILGMMNLRVSEGEFNKITLAFGNNEERGIQFQVRWEGEGGREERR